MTRSARFSSAVIGWGHRSVWEAGRRVDVLDRGSPRREVGVVVLRPQRLEPEPVGARWGWRHELVWDEGTAMRRTRIVLIVGVVEIGWVFVLHGWESSAAPISQRLSKTQPMPRSPRCCCGCRRCSCGRCVRIRPTQRCRATDCWCGPATSAGPRPASTPGCRWATRCSATSSGSSARR